MKESDRLKWLRQGPKLAEAAGYQQVELLERDAYLRALVPLGPEFSHVQFPGRLISTYVIVPLPLAAFPILPPPLFGVAAQGLLKNGRPFPGSLNTIDAWTWFGFGRDFLLTWQPRVEIGRGHHLATLLDRISEILRRA